MLTLTRLRVLFIHDTSRNGGPGRTILYILKFLDPEQIDRTVVIPREGIVSERIRSAGAAEAIVFEPDVVENIIEPQSRPIERRDFDAPLAMRVLRSFLNVHRATRGVLRLIKRVRRERYDVVFCNGTTANFVGGAIARLTNVPVVWHVLYPSVARPIRGLHAWLADSPNVRQIVCVSRATQPQFEHCRAKIRAVQTALDTDEFRAGAIVPALRIELGIGPEVVIFGSHGRILPRKGFFELIGAARSVIAQLSSDERDRCRFVILGDTPEDIQPDHLVECRALVHELGLDRWVQFVGFRPDVRPYVADFDVAVVPSVYEDPLPRAVMEAMALSKPVVAFSRGGIGEMIEDGVEGQLVGGSPPDVDGLAAACLSYYRDKDKRQRHGSAGRHRIERDFDARRHARVLQQMMMQVAASQR